MKQENKSITAALWVCQVIAAAVMVAAGFIKLQGGPVDIFIFEKLGMEPFGRYLITVLEFTAGILLVWPSFSVLGALLSVGTMIGASIAHATVLGFSVQGDGGMHVGLLVLVFVTSGVVLWARRRSLPVIGATL